MRYLTSNSITFYPLGDCPVGQSNDGNKKKIDMDVLNNSFHQIHAFHFIKARFVVDLCNVGGETSVFWCARLLLHLSTTLWSH